MAAETGIPSVYLERQLSHVNVPKKKNSAAMMEMLRCKTPKSRFWTDSIRTVQNSVAERRLKMDGSESQQVQNCLDTMQKAIKVISQQTLKERLDLIGRQLGLFTSIQDQKISLGMDAFHVDIRLSEGGAIADVKLANQDGVDDSPDLKDILKRGDFPEFIEHLQGLQSIYQVTSDEKLKSKAFLALQSLEKDLNQIAQFQSSISGVANYIHKCPLGVMLPRLAGKPMKLIYFVSPYDLLDKKLSKAYPMTVEAITENFLGQSVTVCIEPVGESTPPNELQTMPLMNVSKTPDGKSLPSFSGCSPMNSMMLPASFVLVLPQSIPVSTHVIQKITELTTLEVHKDATSMPLQSLILETFTKGKLKDSNKLLISLPDQHHVYILNGVNGGSQDQQGIMVSRIPFTHPTHVPKILNHMRQQLLFNIVIASCIRPGAREELSDSIVFEVNTVSLQHLTIVFEHPAYDSMITVDVDLSDITNLKCRVSCTNTDQSLCSDEALSRIFQRCMSIPIMLRWLISKGRGQLDKLKEAALAAERERREKALYLKEMQQIKMQPANLPTKSRPPPQPPHPPPLLPPPSYPHHPPQHMVKGLPGSNGQTHAMPPTLAEAHGVMSGLEGYRGMTENNILHNNDRLMKSPDSDKLFTSRVSNLLEEEKGASAGGEVHNNSPMLSKLLDDNTSVATSVIPMNCKPAQNKRPRKRRSQSDLSGPSPKHRFSESDCSDRLSSVGSSMDMDMCPVIPEQILNSAMPTVSTPVPPMTPTNILHGHHPMLNHAVSVPLSQGNVIDLTDDNGGESCLKKLADSVDKHCVRKEVKTEQDLSMLLNENDAGPGRISNILQNSPSSSKNENASTSLEVSLKGSEEVGKAKDFDPADAATAHAGVAFSKLTSLLMAPSDGPASVMSSNPQKSGGNFLYEKVEAKDPFNVGGGMATLMNNTLMQEMGSSLRLQPQGLLQHSSNVELVHDKQLTSGIEKFDMARQQHQQHCVKKEVLENESNVVPSGEGKVSLKLRVGPLKQQNNMKRLSRERNSFDESDLHFPKFNNIGTFDFKSDEDEDDPIMSRYVSSSSPTCLQISTNKTKRLPESALAPKSEKPKKKDKSLGNSTKRKRDKEESKREKKRKKNEHIIRESVYRTVENDEKANFKLKIRVAKKPISEKTDKSDGSEFAEQSYEISKKSSVSPSDNKVLNIKPEHKESGLLMDVVKDRVNTSVNAMKPSIPVTAKASISTSFSSPCSSAVSSSTTTTPSCSVSSISTPLTSATPIISHKSSQKPGNSRTVSANASNSKPDPKLNKATVRLKPVTMPNSSSTINVSQSGPKSAVIQSSNSKAERRSSSSVTSIDKRTSSHGSVLDRRSSSLSVVERRNGLQTSPSILSAATIAATPTTTSAANFTLSSILPNAPNVSEVASLPRIPKLSSSSNTSINRTSSLDPASGNTNSSAGTKTNNSYTVGPGGRLNSSSNSGSVLGSGRSPANNSSPSFNYNNRMATPGSGNVRSNSNNFNANRSIAHRQTSPIGNALHGIPPRPSGQGNLHRSMSAGNANNGSMPAMGGNGQKSGIHSSTSHKSSGGYSNSVLKANNGSSHFNHSTSATMKSFSSGAKMNSVSNNPKVGNVNSNMVGKSLQSASNSVSGQRYIGSNAHSTGSGVRSSVSKSSGTGVSRSPSAGKSPNISGANRSPSLNSASKSPNFSGSKSPSLTSTTRSSSVNSLPAASSGRSPNISNPSRSPSVMTTVTRSSSVGMSAAGKSSLSGSVRHVTNVTKASIVNKSSSTTTKSQPSSSSSPKSTTVSGSISKSSSVFKSAGKSSEEPPVTSSTLSPIQNAGSGSITSVSKIVTSTSSSHVSNAVLNKKSFSGSSQSPTSHISARSPSMSNYAPQKAATTQPNVRSTTPQSYSSLPSSVFVTKSSPAEATSTATTTTTTKNTTKTTQDDNGSKLSISLPCISNSAFPEKASHVTSSNPTTPVSVDIKGKSGCPLSRGRKGSLSAIVDKLKQDLIVPPVATDTQIDVSNKALSKPDLIPKVVGKYWDVTDDGHGETEDMKKISNPFPDFPNKSSSKCDIADFETKQQCDANSAKNSPASWSRESQGAHIVNAEGSLSSVQSGGSVGNRGPKEETGQTNEDQKKSVGKTKEKPKPLTIPIASQLPSPSQSPSALLGSGKSLMSPSSSPFPALQSPLNSVKTSSPHFPKLNGENSTLTLGLKDLDRVFKIPSVKMHGDQQEERSTPPADPRSVSPEDTGKTCLESPSAENKAIACSEKKNTSSFGKSTISPLSDISSPENSLVIDDDECSRSFAKSQTDKAGNSSKSGSNAMTSSSTPVSNPSQKVTKADWTSGSGVCNPVQQIVKENKLPGSPHLSADTTSNSPKTSRPPSSASAKSPVVNKNQSGASTPKGSDSPFEDYDLMDVALGCDS